MKRVKGIPVPSSAGGAAIPEMRTLPLPGRVVLPMQSSAGEVSPVVRSGEEVRAGQCIGRDKDNLVPPVRASIGGTVKEIRPWPDFTGNTPLSILIESNNGADEIEALPRPEGTGQDPRAILELISEAGIREVDPHSWPLAVRLAPPAVSPPVLIPYAPDLRRRIEFLGISAVDRQPGLTLRRSTLAEREGDLLKALPILKKVTSAARTWLAISKGQSVSADFEAALRGLGVEIARCPDRFPLALEHLLIRAITGKEVSRPYGTSRSVGAVTVDVVTALRVLEAVVEQRPALETTVQLQVPSQGVDLRLQVREGTLLGDVLDRFPSIPKDLAKVIVGGLFLGHAQYALDVPLTQETDAVVLQTRDQLVRTTGQACVNCGYCVRSCPVNLLPNELSRLCEHDRFLAAERMDLHHCIECGICAYVCPMQRPMVHLLRFGKAQLAASR